MYSGADMQHPNHLHIAAYVLYSPFCSDGGAPTSLLADFVIPELSYIGLPVQKQALLEGG